MKSEKKPDTKAAEAKRARGTEAADDPTARLRGPQGRSTPDELSEDELEGVAGGVAVTEGGKASLFTPSVIKDGSNEGS